MAMSDRIRRLLLPLRMLWGLEAPTRPADFEPPTTDGAPVHLDRIVILLASRAGRREELRLMTHAMSLHEVHFQTWEDLQEGQSLHLQMLLEPGFTLRIQAHVAEIRRINGQSSGRLNLSCGPFEQGALTAFLARRNSRRSQFVFQRCEKRA